VAEPRESLAKALEGILTPEQLKILIDEVLAITKKAKAEFNCKTCGQRQYQYAEISDALSVARALPELLNQAYGRTVEATVVAEPIRFYRLTKMSQLPKNAPVKPPKPRSRPAGRGRTRATASPPDGLTAA